MASRTLTPANQITILRLIFVPIFAILVVGRHDAGALAVLAVAALSDILDGIVARTFRQVTPLGMALDPIADKVLMSTAFITLSFRGALPWWITIVVLSRDAAILILALLIILVAGYRPFHPTILGKTSTVVQVITVFAALSLLAHMPWVTPAILKVCIYLAAGITAVSGFHYLAVVRNRYAQHTEEELRASASRTE
ncbi:MAG: CDP-alcohol phosphatidyltransferase family protein [Acidobacteria bacterium]|nr:CDP-alcohol phosphatidyltransferase family protein [Acidobacteriota bacterium]